MMQFKEQLSGLSVTVSGPAVPGEPSGRAFRARRRNRHGRGLRGSLLPEWLPGHRTRAEQFDDLVADSAERLRELMAPALDEVGYLVQEVPDRLEALIASGEQAPLGSHRAAVRAGRGKAGNAAVPAAVTIYRQPVEALSEAPWQTRELVHEVLIEQSAALLNLDPDAIDPQFRRFRGH